MIKVVGSYFSGELHTAVYWAVGLACSILIPLFLIDVVHDWVVMGMRRRVPLSMGAIPQIAMGGIGLFLSWLAIASVLWGSLKKMKRSSNL